MSGAVHRPPKLVVISTLALALFAVAFTRESLAAEALKVSASDDAIRFDWHGDAQGAVEVWEEPLETRAGAPSPAAGKTLAWSGEAVGGTASIPRFEGKRDRLYAKFTMVDGGTHEPLTKPQCATDFSAITSRIAPGEPAKGKKGLTCILDIPDAVALGMQQANQNIDIGGLLDVQSATPAASFEFEGRRFGLRPRAVESLDRELRELHQAGMRVTGILLSYVNAKTPRTSPLVHPLTDPATVPVGPAAFNTATAEGLLYYRAILHWLVERYTRADAKYGRLAGLVIGNEVQSHWSWYHLGRVDLEVLIREYYSALRVADLATRSLHADFPIYLSLEHHWTLPASEDPQKGFTAVEVLDGIAARARAEGDFPWNVAFHPYPENLGQPRFWNDRSAPLRFDAPRLTFHNLEVLPAYLRQPRFLYEGHSRRIALTEQGFHCPAGEDGETAQAAAFALAWKKVQALPTIESFLYHRHVDHPLEGGLRCGVREHDGSPNLTGMGRKRKIWDVMQKAGTPEENAAFAFALPVIGRSDWSNVVSEHFDPPHPVHREPGHVIYDFVQHLAEAQRENLQAAEPRRIGPPDEVPQRAMLEHPKPKGLGHLRYRVAIPAPSAGQRVQLVFESVLDNPRSGGVAFAVRVDGRELFNRHLAGGEHSPAEIDLHEFAATTAEIDFVVDALADPAYDWAVWIAPRVVVRK